MSSVGEKPWLVVGAADDPLVPSCRDEKISPRRRAESWRFALPAATDCPGPRRTIARTGFWNFYALMSDQSHKTPIIAAFDAAADSYDAASKVQRDIARKLVARAAQSLVAPPKTILDLGSGAGHVTGAALELWPEAEIVALDAAPAMLAALRAKYPRREDAAPRRRRTDSADHRALRPDPLQHDAALAARSARRPDAMARKT